jgi:hypothetical protein
VSMIKPRYSFCCAASPRGSDFSSATRKPALLKVSRVRA